MLSIYFISEMGLFKVTKVPVLVGIGKKELYVRRACPRSYNTLIITPFAKILHNRKFCSKNDIIFKIISLG